MKLLCGTYHLDANTRYVDNDGGMVMMPRCYPNSVQSNHSSVFNPCHQSIPSRTSGGYTPLHLAAMMDHEEVKELLLKVYKADPAIRDYSGRQMKHYQIVAASKKSMHLVMPRKGTSPTFLVNSAKRTSSQVCFRRFKCIFKRRC